jgi:glutamyl/glutaminyl-tRNA synthetase
VFRGEEHLVNTPKQVLLYRSFSAPTPEFGHLPLMLGTDRKKLSKRTGDTALLDYRDKGFPREAVVNFLCLQGWALNGTQEIFSVADLVQHFDIRDVTKAGAIFDMDKFLWLSGEYLRRETPDELAAHCAPFVVAANLASAAEIEQRRDWFRAVVAGARERIRTYGELPAQIAYLFAADDQLVYEEAAERNARKHPRRIETLRAFLEWLRPRLAQGADVAALREGAKSFQAEQGLKTPELLQPLRCALSGMAGGPDTFDVLVWLGPERSLRRLELALERLS